ncbi:hypothetical protein AAHA92_21819 [Salvia divinorum]|uniref:Uncharacterized protein n=1 Tax=Salvia divinorum TaxID=28513 RepID=A0ABD1GLN9_SALDI
MKSTLLLAVLLPVKGKKFIQGIVKNKIRTTEACCITETHWKLVILIIELIAQSQESDNWQTVKDDVILPIMKNTTNGKGCRQLRKQTDLKWIIEDFLS